MPIKLPWAPLPIPRYQPRQVHLDEGMSQYRGDSRLAPRAAGKGRKTDTNVRPLLDQGDGAQDVAAQHGATPREGGWWFKVVGKTRLGREKRQPLTWAELDTPFEKLARQEYKKLRRTRRRGLTFASRCAPLLYTESIDWHRRYGAIPVVEVKRFIDAARVRAMLEYAHARQVTVWAKTMVWQSAHAPRPPYSMSAAAKKAEPFHEAGFPIALATHGFPPPHDLDRWRHLFDAIWGSNAARYRPKETP